MPLVHGFGHGVSFTPKKAAVVTPPAPTGTTVLLLHLDDNITDASGRHTTSPFGSPAYDTGVFSKAMIASSSGIDLSGNLTDFNFCGSEPFCIEGFICNIANSSGVKKECISRFFDSGFSAGVMLYHDITSDGSTATLEMKLYDPFAGLTHISASVGSLSVASIHFALTWDGLKMRLYFAGNKVAESTPTLSNFACGYARMLAPDFMNTAFRWDEIRVMRGSPVYTGTTLTVPSSPFTV